MRSNPSPLAQQRSWACVDEMDAAVRAIELDLLLLQLAGGSFEGRLLTLKLPPLLLLWFQIRQPLHVLGAKPKGVLTVTLDLDPHPGGAPWRSHGLEVPADSLFGLDVEGEVHFTIPANVNFAVLFLPLSALERWAQQLGWHGFDGELVPRGNVVLTNPLSCTGLRRYLLRLFALAEQRQDRLLSPERQRLILADLIPLLLEALSSGPDANRRVLRSPARIEIVKDVQRWLRANPSTPISLADLCREARASRRTLLQGFQDHLGMGPMAYVKLLRLHGIRRQLVLADAGALQISAVADAWGFHNAGHFAADYRRLFGETPRDTLRRSRPRLS